MRRVPIPARQRPVFAKLAAVLIGLLSFTGCPESGPEPQTESKSKPAGKIALETSPTEIPTPPKMPDPVAIVIDTIEDRGGTVSRSDVGVTAVDWHRAPINNLDLELLTEIPTVRRLYLPATKIDGRGLHFLSSLPQLERLALWKTFIADEDLKSLSEARHLKVLDLSQTAITGSGLKHLADCKELETLILRETPFDRRFLPEIAKRRSLRVLDVWATGIQGRAIAPLKALPNLEELRMYVEPAALPALAEFPNLRRLSLPAAAFPHPMRNISHIANMPKLEVLSAAGHGVRDEFFRQVSKCPRLRALSVRGSSKFSDAGLAHLKDCPTLEILDVRDTNATPEGLRVLTKANPQLKIRVNPIELHGLSQAFRSMGLGAKHFRDGGPRLRLDRDMHIISLRLDDAKIFPQSLKLISQAVDPDKLQVLTFRGTNLTDADLANFRAGVRLKQLDLSGTNITTEGLKALGGGHYPELPALEYLNLSGLTLDADCRKWIGTLDRLKTLRHDGVNFIKHKGRPRT